MSTEQKLDLLIAEIAELKAIVTKQKARPAKKSQPKESKEEITNRLLAKIRVAAEPEKAKNAK